MNWNKIIQNTWIFCFSAYSAWKDIFWTEFVNQFNLSFEATAGAPVPQIENGYIVKDTLDKGFYIEPHGYLDKNWMNFLNSF